MNFSSGGKFAGKTIGQVTEELRDGTLKAVNIPVIYIKKNSVMLIENIRSSLALRRAGIPFNKWNMTDMTGNGEITKMIIERLVRIGLGDTGIDVIRITCFGKYASNLW